MTKTTDNNFNEHSEISDKFESFIQAIFNDYDSGAIDRTQAVLAFKYTFILLEKGHVSAVDDWLKTGRKNIRDVSGKPAVIIDEFWNDSTLGK